MIDIDRLNDIKIENYIFINIFYKYYVYANIHMNEMFKNRIWSYLNDYDEFGIELLKAKKIYKTK